MPKSETLRLSLLTPVRVVVRVVAAVCLSPAGLATGLPAGTASEMASGTAAVQISQGNPYATQRGSRSVMIRNEKPSVVAAFLLMALPALTHAQGILTLTPARTVATTAGTGTPGYGGDGSAATSATLFNPAGAVYDTAGNLYLADSRNHVVRKIAAGTSVISTVAGSGAQGYSGDGGPATAAALDTPIGLALDASGNLYIADSHNHVVRKVAGASITTVAGNGTPGFSGDGAAATSAMLFLPQGVAVDAAGNLYIADTGNHRIREVSGNTISTIAGNGYETYSGDGGPAPAASLDLPSALALDASGNLYIADRHNHAVRRISSGTIATVAGTGSSGFSGDGGPATAATLFLPVAVAVDASGSLYVADSANNRVREVAAASIATVAGSGPQDFTGDGLAATAASFDTPRGVAPGAFGNLAIADTLNQRIRTVPLTTLAFGSEPVGQTSSTLTLVLGNSGSSALQVDAYTLPAPFVAAGGTCSAPPIAIPPSSGCSITLAFAPTAAVPASATVAFNGAGLIPQGLLLTGTGTAGTPALAFSVPKKHDFDPPFQVMATSDSTGSFTYSLVGGPASVSGSTVTLTGAPGTVILQANESPDSNYLAGSATATFAVTRGTVWAGDGSGLSALDLTGIPYASTAYPAGGLAAIAHPQAIAIDASGSEWVAGLGGIAKLDGDGNPVSGSPFTGAGLTSPTALAIDGAGAVWALNAGGTLAVFSGDGTPISSAPGDTVTGPGATGVAIDISGDLWVANATANTVVEVLGAAAPVAPTAIALANGSLGSRP